MSTSDPLLAPMPDTDRREVGGATIDSVRTGDARVRRIIYPAGFRWSTHVQPLVGTTSCEHAHVGFLARGHIHVAYADGCTRDYHAPSVVSIEPGHDAWVGDAGAVLIEFDFERDTVARIGLPGTHQHG